MPDPVVCEHCHGDGQVPGMEYVTHDMAIDAGEPTLEGQPMEFMYSCPTCGGSGTIIKNADAIAGEEE